MTAIKRSEAKLHWRKAMSNTAFTRHATATISLCLRHVTIECCHVASACQLVDAFLLVLDARYTNAALVCIRATKHSLACGLVTARQGNDSSVCTPADDACIATAVLIVLLHSIAGEEEEVLQDSIRLHHSCFVLDRLRKIWINRLRALSNALGVRGVRAKVLPLLPSLFSIVHRLGCMFCSATMCCFRTMYH